MTDMLPDDDSFIDSQNKRKQYLYVRVVKAKDLLVKDVTGSWDPYVEVRLGNYKETTRHLTRFENNSNPEWNQVFAFSRDKIDATMLEVSLENKDASKDNFLGWVLYDLCVVPKRKPPDSPLDPKWCKLENRKGEMLKGELMLAVWWGIRADEAFLEADSVGVANDASVDLISSQSNVYLLPRLWYVRVNVIAGKDLMPSDTTRHPEIFVKATHGNQAMQTRKSMNRSKDPLWNEVFMFVAAEPFEEHLSLSVEDMIGTNKNEVLGSCIILLQHMDRRCDDKPIKSQWFKLQRDVIVEGQKTKQAWSGGMIHMRICLEGGYHVTNEHYHLSSDLRPTDKQLWKKSIGILEVGILSARILSPMKEKEGNWRTTSAYCVAKYGTKWVRTRTIIDSRLPEWHEQYTWEVFDPCTVITIGVFDNCHLQGGDKGNQERDSRIGKVRLRVSTLQTDRVYTCSYPLLVLHPSGVKMMGEIHLAVRFTCSSLLNMTHMYFQPLLPKMHYTHPLAARQLESLRYHAMQIVSTGLSQTEPPLKKDIVEYMLDVGCDQPSLRRSKANFFRIMAVFGHLIFILKWSTGMYNWKNPTNSVAHHIIFFILVMYSELILPFIFLYLSLIGIYNYRWRPRHPLHMDVRLSFGDNTHTDELEEEFDTFLNSHPGDITRMRYNRLRSVFGRIQTLVGDFATLGEKLLSLLSWRDPRATSLFIVFCLVAAIVLYTIPFYAVAIQTILYVSKVSRPNKLPSVPMNFIRRLPARSDQML
ncbi:FT-interacting protein 3-like [Bidens hawaiensis]|uniref:FT-interacting protein 3-like n=1 Tax=Bidens hawaiensis TaxID=980011 RepID=UPI00404A303D